MYTTESPRPQRGEAGKSRRQAPVRQGQYGPIVSLIVFVAAILLFVLPSILGGGTEEETATPETLSGVTEGSTGPAVPAYVTQDLLPINRFSRPATPLTEVTGVVVHYIGNPGTTAQQNRDYFASLAESGETSASSHFIIDTDGSVIQCVPLDEVAYCSNARNDDTISIEVCHLDETGAFTQQAYDTLVELLAWLCDTYDIGRDGILRHGDVYEKMCPLYYMENPQEWERLKDDVVNFQA